MTRERASENAAPLAFEEEVRFPSPNGTLAGVLGYPEDDALGGVLLLSPHPRYGGDAENNVIRALGAGLARHGLATLRFDYHGVGKSENPYGDELAAFRYWSRVLESDAYGAALDDARAALEWLRAAIRPVAPEGVSMADLPIGIAGYSFGAVLGLRLAAERTPVTAVAAIGLAVGDYRLDFLEEIERPILAVHSQSDFATSIETLESVLSRAPIAPRCEILEDTDHFFRKREADVVAIVGGFLARSGTPQTEPR